MKVKHSEKVKRLEEQIERNQKLLSSKEVSLSQTVKSLESQVSTMTTKNLTLTTELSQTIIMLEEIKKLNLSKDETLKELRQANDKLQSSCNDLSTSLRTSTSEKNAQISELQANLAREKDKIRLLEKEHELELKRVLAEVEQIVTNGIAKGKAAILQERDVEIARMDKTLREEKDKKLEADKEIHELQMKNIGLSREITELKGVMLSATDKLNSFEAMKTRSKLLEKEILDKGTKIEQINKTLDEFQKIIEKEQITHNAAMAKMTHQRDMAEKELETARIELSKMHGIIQQHDVLVHRSEDMYKKRVAELEAVLREKEEVESASHSKLYEAMQSLKDRETQLRDLSGAHERLQKEADLHVRVNEEQRLMIERLNKKIEELQIQVSMQRKAPSESPNDSITQNKEIEEIQGKFREALSQLGFIKLSAAKLEAEMEAIIKENLKLKKALLSESSREQTKMDLLRREPSDYGPLQDGRSKGDNVQSASQDIRIALDQAYDKVENLQQELLECKSDLYAVVRQRNDLSKMSEYYQNQVESLTEELSARNTEILALKSKVSKLELDSMRGSRSLESTRYGNGFESNRSNRNMKDTTNFEAELRLKEQQVDEAEMMIRGLQSQLDKAMDDKNRLALMNTNFNEELTRSRRKAEELEGIVESLRSDYTECKSQLSTLKHKLLSIESKSSVQNVNYEEVIKDKENQLLYRDQMIEQLTKDCEGLLSRMKNDDDAMVSNDAKLERLLTENRILQKEVKDLRLTEESLYIEIESLKAQNFKFKGNSGDSGTFDSIMQANALKERQLQMKIGTLEQRVADLLGELSDVKGAHRRESVYREEAERFRLMYNDCQRELIKVKEDLEQRMYEGSPYRAKVASYLSSKKTVRETLSPNHPRTKTGSIVSEKDRSHLNSSVENYRFANDSKNSDN